MKDDEKERLENENESLQEKIDALESELIEKVKSSEFSYYSLIEKFIKYIRIFIYRIFIYKCMLKLKPQLLLISIEQHGEDLRKSNE